MDIVLALLRTLIFVVATVAAAVYVSRRVARGLPLLWTGATLLVLNWLIDFGWVTYQAGSPDTVEVAGWVVWSSHLLTFIAALAFIWGIGLAAGFGPRAKPDAPEPHAGPPAELAAGAGAAVGLAPEPAGAPSRSAGWHPTGGTPSSAGAPSSGMPAAGAAAGAGAAGAVSGGAGAAAAPPAGTHTEPHRRRPRPPGLVVPHAVPVVMTPASHHHSPPRPAAVVDLGPQNPVVPAGGLGHPGVEVRDLRDEAPVAATPTEEDPPATSPDQDGPATS